MMDVEGEDIQAEGDCSKKSGVAGVYDWSNEGPEQEEGRYEGPPEDCSEAVEGLASQPGREMFEFSYF